MPLPTCKCPVCHTVMSIDVLLADDAPRDALMAIVNIHPQGERFIKPLLRYVGLFAPLKSQMSHSRIAGLINEIEPMVKAGKIERNGITHIAPLDYWIDAINAVLTSRDTGKITLPLKSHGYLLEVIASRASAAAAKIEQKKEDDARAGKQRAKEAQAVLTDTSNVPVDKATARENLARIQAMMKNKGMNKIGDIAEKLKSKE